MSNIVIEFEVERPKLISVNDQYIHPVRKTKNGRYTSYFAKSPYLKEVQSFYSEILKEKILDEDIESLKKLVRNGTNRGIDFKMILGMPEKDLRGYDASNYIKAIEDCIVSRIGIDDSVNYRVTVEKQIYEPFNSEGEWIVKIYLTPITVVRYEKLNKQNNGGNENESEPEAVERE